MKKCPFCGAELSDEVNFCVYCMTSLDQKQKAVTIKKKKRLILPIIIILSTVLILAAMTVVIAAVGVGIANNTNAAGTSPTVSKEPSVSTEVYIYRAAVMGDDYLSTNIPAENDIVIIGIEKPSESGIYNIPDMIDGKRVIAIDSLAFSGDEICKTVKKVILPETVRTLWENVFAGCVNMSDIYLTGESIHIDVNAFSESRNTELKIHCSDVCDDRNFRYYKNNAATYGAVYEYWDGGAID
ncbi:MAG: leucine-rich repeat protein [Clostridia bacterium]|nr:leucine-rich repeat protein [Clostridia bacterium]